GFEVTPGGHGIPGLQSQLGPEDEATATYDVILAIAPQGTKGFVDGPERIRNHVEIESASGFLLQRHAQDDRHIRFASRRGRRARLFKGRRLIAEKSEQPG